MNGEDLLHLVEEVLDDMKAEQVRVLDVRAQTTITDYMVIASGRSDRQVRAMAERVVECAKAAGVRPLGVEGARTGEWVLIDLGDVVVHAMQPQVRDFYQLEKLWETTAAARRRAGESP